MLVLTRTIGQSVHIGDGVTVTITDVDGQRVRLAIEAPQDVAILREELEPWPETASGRAEVSD